MPHIALPAGLPGIVGPMAFRPVAARVLNELAEVLLRAPNSLTPGERELIAATVSAQEDCHFCAATHGAVATRYLGDAGVVEAAKRGDSARLSQKMKALLDIAGRVRVSGHEVTDREIEQARGAGATDEEIHDTVLIAAAFCMYCRYVDGLAAWSPREPEIYDRIAEQIVTAGYDESTQTIPVKAGH